MWLVGKSTRLPRTKTAFYITSTKSDKFFVKSGKAFVYRDGSWSGVKGVAMLDNKIDRVIVSPNGLTSVHLPKYSDMLAVHTNTGQGIVLTLPLPKTAHNSGGGRFTLHCQTPEYGAVIMTNPYRRLSDMNFVLGKGKRDPIELGEHVQGMATSEDGQVMAIAIDQYLWVWQQYPEEMKGVGFWTNLTCNQRFIVGTKANHVLSANGRIAHGVTRPRQCFTLDPVLAPNVPQNSAISYQDLVTFDNPDEGRGVCCFTVVLPPCKPFDTTYMFNSVCIFDGSKPTFYRADVTLPVDEGDGSPCIWWTTDCRICVIAVSKSIVVATRFLRVIAIIPLMEIFVGDSPIVACVSWSCSGQFCLITSTDGQIGGVTRSGISMKHSLCHLTPFQDKAVALMVAGDSKDPARFTIYSRDCFREVIIDMNTVKQNLASFMSLHFPQRTAEHMWKPTIQAIIKNGCSEPIDLIRLAYYTDMFRIWPYHSPLRWTIWKLFNEAASRFLEENRGILTLFACRCVFRITEKEVDAYDRVCYRLGLSDNPAMQYIKRILEDERGKKDYVTPGTIDDKARITVLDEDQDDVDAKHTLRMPHHGRDVDLEQLIENVNGILYEDNYDVDKIVEGVNLRLLFELVSESGDIQKAILMARHSSIACDVPQVFARIANAHPDEPGVLFAAMQACIRADPGDEIEIRAYCLTALLNILKQRVANSTPKASNRKTKFLSSLISVEETLEVIEPRDLSQLNDFAVIVGIGFAAADYTNCANYFNGRIKMIPSILRTPLRELFGLIWFVRWRYAAICESARCGRANDATLRLLAFPDFVNRSAAMAQIRETGEAGFSPDAYALYVDGSCIMEKDPAFVDFAVQCSHRITPRALTRLASTVMNFCEGEKREFPQSRLLLAVIVSHLVPWLRCGIPRGIIGFDCKENIPRELLDLEDFQFPRYRAPKMEIQQNIITPIEEEEEEPEAPPPPPVADRPVDDSTDGEFIQSSASSEVSEKPRKRREPKKTKRTKRPVKRRRSRDEPEPDRRPRGPALRLLSLDPTARQGFAQYQANPPVQPSYPQRPQPAFQPIWDYNPAQFGDRPAPVAKPPNPPVDPPLRTAQTFVPPLAPRKAPEPVKPASDFDDISDSSSDHAEHAQIHEDYPRADQFPLDNGLHRRVEKLLDVAKADPDPDSLPTRKEFQRETMKRKRAARTPADDDGVGSTGGAGGTRSAVHTVHTTVVHEQSTVRRMRVTETTGTSGLGGRQVTFDGDDSWRPKVASHSDPSGTAGRRPPPISAAQLDEIH